MPRRICILLLTLSLCLSVFMPASAGFSDVSDQATQNAATLLRNLGIVDGYGDGTFRPDNNLTRAQFCKMAVMLAGTYDITAYEGFTIFPDVRAEHWGRAYINTATRALKIIAGFPDGTFKPDIPISFAQAVTTLMRLLGYTDSDVGANWPHGYLDKASQIGLTKGISLYANDSITRGLSAQLFYNAIFASNKAGVKYSDTLGFKESKVIVLQPDGVSPDGVTRGLVTIGGSGFYPYRSELSIDEGSQGMLLEDKDGYALSFAPDKQTKKDITVRDIGPMSVTGPDGSRIDNIPSSAMVISDGKSSTWEKSWVDITPGHALRFFFSATGAVDYILLFQPSGNGEVIIITSAPSAGRNPLPSLGVAADAKVFKNGTAASWTDLRLNDVLIYNVASNTVSATDFRITAVYENASPSREAPDYVTTLGGSRFAVLANARQKLAARKLGDTLTFYFTSDNRVADVRTTDTPVYQPGITSGDRSVKLFNGMVISGDGTLAPGYGDGAPVLVCMTRTGSLSLQAVPSKGITELDIKSMKAGTVDIAPYAVFVDLCAANGRAVQVDKSALPDSIAAKSVLSVLTESGSGGNADLIVLQNVTGDAWLYGFTTVERASHDYNYIKDENGNVIDVTDSGSPNMVHIENQYPKQSFEDPANRAKDSGSNIYGLAIGTNGVVLASQACVRVNNVGRADFSGNTSLTVSGVARPIPAGLKVYVQATGEYLTIAEARVYSNNFSVFLDKPAAEGGKPRFIIAM